MHGQCEDFASHPQGVINAPPRRFTMGAIRSQASGGEVRMPIIEYEPGTAFPGVVGRTADESVPAWPAPVRAREGAPNVLFIVLDDTGFGQLGCYGSLIATPSFDALAADGLRYSNMHTTALCSPSRSCILIGPKSPQQRDGVHHRAGQRLSRVQRHRPI